MPATGAGPTAARVAVVRGTGTSSQSRASGSNILSRSASAGAFPPTRSHRGFAARTGGETPAIEGFDVEALFALSPAPPGSSREAGPRLTDPNKLIVVSHDCQVQIGGIPKCISGKMAPCGPKVPPGPELAPQRHVQSLSHL